MFLIKYKNADELAEIDITFLLIEKQDGGKLDPCSKILFDVLQSTGKNII